MSTALYRHFANDGALLYVGVSLSWPARTKAHSRNAQWFNQVARVEIEHFPTRDEALEAERAAIKSEHPKHNIMHNRAVPEVPPHGSSRRPWNAGSWVDPIFEVVKGPDAVVGPALIYRDDMISLMIAHGEFGSPGTITEITLGEWAGEMPAIAEFCDTVISITRGGQISMDEAQQSRAAIVLRLKQQLRTVEVFDTDMALAIANASRFPSDSSRQIVDEMAAERGSPC